VLWLVGGKSYFTWHVSLFNPCSLSSNLGTADLTYREWSMVKLKFLSWCVIAARYKCTTPWSSAFNMSTSFFWNLSPAMSEVASRSSHQYRL
jgi:hypothetical protein